MITLTTILVLLCLRLIYNCYKDEFNPGAKIVHDIFIWIYVMCVAILVVTGVAICLFLVCLLIKAIVIYLP
jgi:cytochrome b subunit of formate dehydrogenase